MVIDGMWQVFMGKGEVQRGFWVGHEESRDSAPAAINLILSGPSKLSRARIPTSQPT